MKHVGLNVAADPLFTFSYTGVNGGMVIAVADDPGMHSSQNEQDSRHYTISAKLPMFEPSDSNECKEFTKIAYDISEIYDTPVLLRLTTRVANSRSVVELKGRKEIELSEYIKDHSKNVMLPAFARHRHELVEERIKKLYVFVENKPGRIAQITEIISEARIYIRALSIADTSDFGILRLIENKPDKAADVLKKANITVLVTSVIAIGIDDKPGEFSNAIKILADEGISIEYMYAFISRDRDKAFVILRIEKEDRASEVLKRNGIALLTAEQIHGMKKQQANYLLFLLIKPTIIVY